jgi:hypothetical protein
MADDTLMSGDGAGSGIAQLAAAVRAADERMYQLFTEVTTAGKASCTAVLAHLHSAEKGRLSGTCKAFQQLLSKPAVWSKVQLSTQAVPHWRKFKPYKRYDGSIVVKELCPFNTVFAGMCSALTRQPRSVSQCCACQLCWYHYDDTSVHYVLHQPLSVRK